MDKMSCLIVEDEIPAAEELKYILSQHPQLDIKGMAHDGESAYKLIESINPKVVFMDINIPMGNGMELAGKVKELDNNIDIIFVTAYEQHALKAFEVEALDYILKPYDEKRIDATVRRLTQKNIRSKDEVSEKVVSIINKLHDEDKLMRKIPCEDKGKIVLINVDEVQYCFIEGEKVFVKTVDKKYFTNYNLYELEDRTKYFRAHRSYLINIDHIKELYSWFNGTYKIVMNDEEKSEVPVSRNNVKKLKEVIGL